MSNSLVGLEEMLAGFKDFGERLNRNEIIGVKLAANAYKNDVQEAAPYKTGTLRRSIHVEMIQEGGSPIALVGTDLPYAKRLEFGFIDKDKLGRVYHQAARPYFRPPLEQNVDKYQSIILEQLAK